MKGEHILTRLNVAWYLDRTKGRVLGYEIRNEKVTDIVQYEYWIANPPEYGTKSYEIFSAICEFAVACGMLRPIRSYGGYPSL